MITTMSPSRTPIMRALTALFVIATLPLAPLTQDRVATAAPSQTGSTAPPVLVLMDLSTSMNESDGTGQTRIEGAKRAAIDFVQFISQIAPGTRVGLNSYPISGCDAGVSEIGIQAVSSAEMDRRIRSLRAQGSQTPTAAALEKAGEDLKLMGGTGVIVLVSDGEANCGPDPCETARSLVASGIDVTVNTVGFQVSAGGKDQLQCIADATGGTYVEAEDSEELKDQFRHRALPDLRLELDHPVAVVVRPGQNNSVTVGATVSNLSIAGGPVAGDVQVVITFDAGFSPGNVRPRQRVGNLNPGDSVVRGWTIRPSDEFLGEKVSFTVSVLARGMEPITQQGEIDFRPSSDDAIPAWLRGAEHIVVMGDSYSSGEGVRPVSGDSDISYDAPTDTPWNSCHRHNELNYGGQLAEMLPQRPKVTTLACSGAVTEDFWLSADLTDPKKYHRVDGTQRGAPLSSQNRQLRDLDDPPDLVILTIGGNDAGFEDLILHCLGAQALTYVSPVLVKVPVVVDCENDNLFGMTGRAKLERGVETLTENLPTVYRSVARQAERSAGRPVPILVLPYPVPFPNRGNGCEVVDLYLGLSHSFLNRMAVEVNASVERAVADARTEGWPVSFVAPVADMLQDGHTYCDKDPWIVTLSATGMLRSKLEEAKGRVTDMANWIKFWGDDWTPDHRNESRSMAHPNVAGYRAEAAVFLDWASVNPDMTPPDPDPAAPPQRTRPVQMKLAASVPLDGTDSIQLQAGSAYRLEASGYAPGTRVDFHIESSPEPLGFTYADEDGVARRAVILREDFPLGNHHLVSTGLDPEGEAREVRRGTSVQSAAPWWVWPATIAAIVLALAGVIATAIAALQRRRDSNRKMSRPSGRPRAPRRRPLRWARFPARA